MGQPTQGHEADGTDTRGQSVTPRNVFTYIIL